MSQFRVLVFLVLLNFSMLLSAVVMGYKLVTLHGLVLSCSIYVLPISYMCNDIIAELYGYRISRTVIGGTFTCLLLFSSLIYLFLWLPSVPYWRQQFMYEQALGGTMRFSLAMMLGLLIGDFINAYLLTKWKAILHGRAFWLRSLGSTALGDFIATIIGFSIAFIGVIPWDAFVELTGITYIIKLIFNVACVLPNSLIVTLLKLSWLKNTPEHGLVFNPFAEYSKKPSGDLTSPA